MAFGSTTGVLLLACLPLWVVFGAAPAQPQPQPQQQQPAVDSDALMEALLRHREELQQQEQALRQQYYGYGSLGGVVGSYSEPTEGDVELEGLGDAIGTGREREQLFESDAPAEVDDAASSYFELPAGIGQTAGLAVDGQQRLVLFHRAGRVWDASSFSRDHHFNRSLGAIANATIALLDTRSGKVLAEHGAHAFYMPHGLTVDHDGHAWVTDVGTHQVHKLHRDTFRPLLTLGEHLVPGADAKHFCKPTDVAVAKNGDFFVADGYCNSRVMKFNKEGTLLAEFGQPNSEVPPKIGEFLVPHSLALIEDLNLLCVADRENERIQCFAAGLTDDKHYHPRAFVPTGTFFTKAEHIGRVFAIREKQHYLVGVTDRDERESLEPQVFVMDMNTGRANTFAKGLENAHALALSDNGDIYVSQMNPSQIVKFSVPAAEAVAAAQ